MSENEQPEVELITVEGLEKKWLEGWEGEDTVIESFHNFIIFVQANARAYERQKWANKLIEVAKKERLLYKETDKVIHLYKSTHYNQAAIIIKEGK